MYDRYFSCVVFFCLKFYLCLILYFRLAKITGRLLHKEWLHFFSLHNLFRKNDIFRCGNLLFFDIISFFCNFLHKTVYFIAFLAVFFIFFFKIKSRYRHKYYLVGICVLFSLRLFVCFILKTFQYFVWKLGILYDDNKKKNNKKLNKLIATRFTNVEIFAIVDILISLFSFILFIQIT